MKVWQIATGEPGRDYKELFLDHDIMINGPSHLGNARDNSYNFGAPNSSTRQVHNFAHGPRPGDRVLMRSGKRVMAIGIIPQGEENQYSFQDTFKCVYGWDLCHCRRVKWNQDYDLGSLATVYKNTILKPAFTAVIERHIYKMALDVPESKFDVSLKELPNVDTRVYDHDELGVELFGAGISSRNTEEISLALRQAARLIAWYRKRRDPGRPTEQEVVSHVILPLLLGLGWSHQQIAVEWNKVDIAFFKTASTKPADCVMLLEAKGLGKPLKNVFSQPRKYIEKLGLTNCRIILTTDGDNLFVYERSGSDWTNNPNPVGYFSVTSLQREYVLPHGCRSVDTLVRLQPSAI